MRNLVLLSFILIILVSCNQNKTKSDNSEQKQDSIVQEVKEAYPDLVQEEIFLEEDAFGEIIELAGTPHPVDNIFRISETKMIANDSMLIVKNPNEGNTFMTYSLPDFKFIKSFGLMGKGPGEFMFPTILKSQNPDYLCYIYQRFHDKLFSFDHNYNMNEVNLPKASTNRASGDKQLFNLADNHFIYAESVKGGKAIFDFQFNEDTVIKTELYNLSFSPNHKNWASYIGDFGANKDKKRAVFAYKKFKRLVFIDTEKGTNRVINFKVKDAKTGNVKDMLAPDNVTHYWGMSAQENYVYCLYSGRTPLQVGKELRNTSGYIYVEQFDWNGNPIRKFKLDHWGYFLSLTV